jgi:hypothetical protein
MRQPSALPASDHEGAARLVEETSQARTIPQLVFVAFDQQDAACQRCFPLPQPGQGCDLVMRDRHRVRGHDE